MKKQGVKTDKLPETYFVPRPDGTVTLHTPVEGQQLLELPPKTYLVKYNMEVGFYLKEEEAFRLPKRVYGKSHLRVERYLKTYESRPGNMAVMLSGPKGSGKTTEAKLISIKGAAMGMPTLKINRPYQGDEFNEFLTRIKQDALVVMDEFEKTYSRTSDHGQMISQQEQLLTLLDGLVMTKKLFVLIANDISRVDPHLMDRPSRVFYHTVFTPLDLSVGMDYVHENLKNKDPETVNTLRIMIMAGYATTLNLDMLAELVGEMNRYGESPADAFAAMFSHPFRAAHPPALQGFNHIQPNSIPIITTLAVKHHGIPACFHYGQGTECPGFFEILDSGMVHFRYSGNHLEELKKDPNMHVYASAESVEPDSVALQLSFADITDIDEETLAVKVKKGEFEFIFTAHPLGLVSKVAQEFQKALVKEFAALRLVPVKRLRGHLPPQPNFATSPNVGNAMQPMAGNNY